jgi:aminopeptidase N
MTRIITLLLILLNINITIAQNYNRADSLRGCLTPERDAINILRYDLHLKFNIDSQTISGYNDITFKTSGQFSQLQFDLFENLQIDGIEMNFFRLNYVRENNAFFVHFPETPQKGEIYKMRVYYSGKPQIAKRAPWDGGFVWSKTPDNKPWIGVACEGLGASVWFPCKDHLSDEPDSGMTFTMIIPDTLQAISNGRLKYNGKEDEVAGITYQTDNVWKWEVTYPINNYNISFYISDYVHFGDIYVNGNDTLTLDYYVLPQNLTKAKEHFIQVKKTIKAFEYYFGKYPFYKDGYKLVETPYAGMEHQSAIAYGNKYMPGYWGNHIQGIDFDYIIIHESGHEWWGNNVSVKDIADLWIHEGFCTYSEVLYVENYYGTSDAMRYVNKLKNRVANDKPIIGDYEVNNEGSGDMYNKGALMIHSLRSWINNDSVFFALLKNIQQEFAYETVESKQIENYITQFTGMKLKPFFNQYLRNAELPVLEYYFEGKKIVFYRWNAVKDFNMPVFVTTSANKYEQIYPTGNWQKIDIKLKSKQFKIDDTKYFFSIRQITE